MCISPSTGHSSSASSLVELESGAALPGSECVCESGWGGADCSARCPGGCSGAAHGLCLARQPAATRCLLASRSAVFWRCACMRSLLLISSARCWSVTPLACDAQFVICVSFAARTRLASGPSRRRRSACANAARATRASTAPRVRALSLALAVPRSNPGQLTNFLFGISAATCADGCSAESGRGACVNGRCFCQGNFVGPTCAIGANSLD